MTKNILKINFKPDRTSNETLYKQLLNYFISNTLNGSFLVGDYLPSQRKLAEQLGVNRSTVVEVLAELNALGIVTSKTGHGTYISNNTWSLYTSKSTPEWNHYINSNSHRSNLPTIQAINTYEFDTEMIRLSTGEMSPDLFPHNDFKIISQNMPSNILSLNYLEPLGLLELRQAIVDHVKEIGIQIDVDDVLIVSGSLQALQLISLGLLDKGSTIYLEDPSYAKSLNVFQSNSMNLKGLQMDIEGLCPWLQINNKKVQENSILYTIPTFHNPTNTVMTLSRRHDLLNWAKSLQLPIIEDDAYRELWFDENPPKPLKSLDSTGNVLYLGSASKCLAPGLRIGWVIGPKPVISRLADIKMQTDYGASSVSQWMLKEWLTSGLYDQHIRALRIKLKERRDYLDSLLRRHFIDLGHWLLPQGGYYIWLELNNKIDTIKLFDTCIKEKIIINPGSIYSFKNNSAIRLSYCYTSFDQMDYAIKRLSEIIRKQKIH